MVNDRTMDKPVSPTEAAVPDPFRSSNKVRRSNAFPALPATVEDFKDDDNLSQPSNDNDDYRSASGGFSNSKSHTLSSEQDRTLSAERKSYSQEAVDRMLANAIVEERQKVLQGIAVQQAQRRQAQAKNVRFQPDTPDRSPMENAFNNETVLPSIERPATPSYIRPLEQGARSVSYDPRSASPYPTPTHSGPSLKTIGLPDPPKLDDGVEVTFKHWRRTLEDKLFTNYDHFPNEDTKMAYVYSRTEGAAAEHLLPIYRSGASGEVHTAAELIVYLADIYGNPNEVREYRQQYRDLLMDVNERFTAFRTRFTHLANGGLVNKSEWMDDLYLKITPALAAAYIPIRPDVTDFSTMCARLVMIDSDQMALKDSRAHRTRLAAVGNLRKAPVRTEQVSSGAAAYRSRPAETANAGTSAKLSPAPQIAAPYAPPQSRSAPAAFNRAGSANPRASKSPADVKCYNCGKMGHYRNNCPEPANPTVRALEMYGEQSSNQELMTEIYQFMEDNDLSDLEELESGNGQA